VFELKEGKVTFKVNDEKVAKAAGRSFTIKVDGERLAKLQRILSYSRWKNSAKVTASDDAKWYKEQTALKVVAVKLLDFAIDQHEYAAKPKQEKLP